MVTCIVPGKFGSSNLSVCRIRFEILPAEGVALARGEVRERHLVGATNAGLQVVNFAGESVWRDPFYQCVRIEERSIDPLGRTPEHTVKADGAGHN
jgi:hypothetical protein